MRNKSGTERCGNQTPFRRRVGVRETSAERPTHADRIVRNMTGNDREQLSERIGDHGFVERRMAHAGAN